MNPAELLLDARRRACLSQRELAARAATSQAAVHRYERGRAVPPIATLMRLLHACGLRLAESLAPVASGGENAGLAADSGIRDDIRYVLGRTMEQRLSDLRVSDERVKSARRVG